MFRLAHLSDIHLGPLPDVTVRQLASKRITGYVNWQRNRKGVLDDAVLDALTTDLKTIHPDHIALTGDLVNLALDAEIEVARLWLQEFGGSEAVSLVPGNHDAYVPGAFDKICAAWGKYMAGDGEEGPISRKSFPYLRVRGNIAFIGATSARASAPFMASGYFRDDQAERMDALLDEAKRRGLFRVVMIHHPPVHGATAPHKRLFGIARFQRVIREHGAELVLHGHTHLSTVHWIEGPKSSRVPVVGVAAAGESIGEGKPLSQYNLFTIDGEPDNWSIHMMRRGLSRTTRQIYEHSSFQLTGSATHPAESPVNVQPISPSSV
ncbi:metallophosphoesterase [Tianweitania sp. BSSL-BM11]|uniref:Metallophosphoesterase n=1 Tax=Tianweitania aestuarii TaxID=2814886 RepID=A0ABS5RWE7_9HYPH|nr:metallophosphoesterase [Tianweitania aestuarii]MBS9721100.1 metallophosphoesterase [Tianweitania aestuarii]